MKYRCPYCGEPAFSTAEKMGIPVGHFGKYAAFFPTCPHCKQIARRAATQRSRVAIVEIVILFAAIFIPLFLWVTGGAAMGIALLLGAVGYVSVYYFLFHFDKPRSQVSEDAVFTVVTNTTERLPLRIGNIYVCRMLDRNPTNGIPQVIGLVDRVEQVDGKQRITLRVIRCDDATLPVVDERVRIFTDSRFDVEGSVAFNAE